jgi:hypothetical protein
MTTRVTVALAALLGLVESILGQTPDGPLPAQPLMPGMVLVAPGEPAPCFEEAPPCTPERFWVRGDYLLGWMNGMRLPPLATTSIAGTSKSLAGVLGAPGTAVLFGNDTVNEGVRSGGRLMAGYWFECLDRMGIEAGGFLLGGQGTRFGAASDGTSILARPFFDAFTNNPLAILLAFPGVSKGVIDISASSNTLYGGNLDLTELAMNNEHARLTALVGYRFLEYNESLQIDNQAAPLAAPFVPGTLIRVEDRFDTHNQFNGVEGGFRLEFFRGDWSLELLAKGALGRLNREVNIAGGTQTAVPGSNPAFSAAGLLALPSNIGPIFSSDWAIASDLGASVSYRLTDQIRLRLGYLCVYWAKVARAGDQVDLVLNQGFFPPFTPPVPGPQRPQIVVHGTDLWVQSLTFGVEVRY